MKAQTFFVVLQALALTLFFNFACGDDDDPSTSSGQANGDDNAADDDAADDDSGDDDSSDDDSIDDDAADDDVADDDTINDDTVNDDIVDDDSSDDDTVDDDTVDDDTSDDDTVDDDTADDDTIDDDTIDDDTVDDDFTPPTPVYGYYQEGSPGNWTWLESQLAVFAEYGLTLFLGMDSVDLGQPVLLQLLRAAETQGVEVRAWLLLPYASGYWPGELNVDEYTATALAFAQWFVDENIAIEWIVVDMETDVNLIAQLNQLIEEGRYLEAGFLLLEQYSPDHFAYASELYQQMVDDLYALGFYSMVVTAPMLLDDLADGDTFLQDVMNIPVSTVKWHEVSTMVYTTTFEEYLGLNFGPYVVYDYALSTLEYFPQTASIALGVSSQMETPEELAVQIAAAKAAGIERIQVYSYSCTLTHPNPEEWHAAFQTPAQIPAWEPSTLLLRGLLNLADQLF